MVGYVKDQHKAALLCKQIKSKRYLFSFTVKILNRMKPRLYREIKRMSL